MSEYAVYFSEASCAQAIIRLVDLIKSYLLLKKTFQ